MSTDTTGNFRFTIIGLMASLAIVNYIDRGAISYAASFITAEYALDRQAWGAVLGYFGYGYMIGALIGGVLGDRFGAKRVWLCAGAAWSIFEIATAYAGDIGIALFGGSALTGFAIIRVLFGLSEGPAYAMINKSVGNWTKESERGFAVSLGLLSTPLGALLTAPVAVGLLSVTGDWRATFWILGLSGLALLVVFGRVFTDRPDQNRRVSQAELAEIGSSNVALEKGDCQRVDGAGAGASFFRSRTMVCNMVGYFAFMYVNFMLLTWTPKYLQDQFGFSFSSLWYLGMIPWVGPCVTILVGGRVSDWLLRTTGSLRKARSWFASFVLLCTTCCFLMIPHAQTPAGVIALMALGNSLNSLVNPVYWAVVLDTAPRSKVGTWSGIMHFFANAASVIAPTLTGFLAAKYGYSSMFIATAVVTGIGTLAMLLVSPGIVVARADLRSYPA